MGILSSLKKSYQFRIRLKDIDIDIIKKFKKDIMSTSPIYNRNGYCEMNICNREFVYNMIQYGFSNNKTYNIKFSKIKDEFMIDFIKGCFDGDGSYVCTDKTKKISFVSASYDLVEGIINELSKRDIKCYLCKRETYITFEISKKDSIKKFINLIINTKSDFLDRKLYKINKLLECI